MGSVEVPVLVWATACFLAGWGIGDLLRVIRNEPLR